MFGETQSWGQQKREEGVCCMKWFVIKFFIKDRERNKPLPNVLSSASAVSAHKQLLAKQNCPALQWKNELQHHSTCALRGPGGYMELQQSPLFNWKWKNEYGFPMSCWKRPESPTWTSHERSVFFQQSLTVKEWIPVCLELLLNTAWSYMKWKLNRATCEEMQEHRVYLHTHSVTAYPTHLLALHQVIGEAPGSDPMVFDQWALD